MLSKIRAGTQTLGAKILAAIICFVLVVFGFGTFNLFAISPPAAAVVNGEDITEEQLRRSTMLQRQNFMNLYGDQFEADYIERVVSEGSVLRQLVNTELLMQEAESLGLAASRAKFEKDVQSNPAFMEDGEFSEERFRQALASSGFSTKAYEEQSGRDAILRIWTEMSQGTSFLTDGEIRKATEIAFERRDIAYITWDPNQIINDIEVSDEEIQAYYDENPETFMTDEAYTFEYVELQSSDFEVALELSDEELLELYEEESKAVLSNAERKSSHILVEVGDGVRTVDEARDILVSVQERLNAGESFADLAREISDDSGSAGQGGDLGFAGRGAFVAEFEDQLFNMDVGEISEPVETMYGLHIIKLDEIQSVDLPPLEERAEELRTNRIEAMALDEFNSVKDELDRIAYEQSDSLVGVVAELGLELKVQEGVTRGSGEGPFSEYAVLNVVLEDDVLLNGFNSRLAEVAEGHVIVARLVSSVPATLQSLDEVRDTVTTRVKVRMSRQMVTDARDEALAKLKETGEYSDVSSDERQWVRRPSVRNNDPEINQTILDVAFGLRAPMGRERQLAPVDGPGADRSIVVVSRARAGDIEATTEADKTSITQQLSDESTDADLLALIDALRNEADLEFLVSESN